MSNNVTAVNRLLSQFDELQRETTRNYERWRLSRQLRVNSSIRMDQLREQANRVSRFERSHSTALNQFRTHLPVSATRFAVDRLMIARRWHLGLQGLSFLFYFFNTAVAIGFVAFSTSAISRVLRVESLSGDCYSFKLRLSMFC